MALLVNCDLGEDPSMAVDKALMPYLDQANIACGFHAGSPAIMKQSLTLAKQHQVSVGAHPGYPDLAGFGRRSMALGAEEIVALMQYQIAAFDGLAQTIGLLPSYVKPHGALYTDMMTKAAVRQAIMQSIAEFHRPLVLFLQATPNADSHRKEAEVFGIEVIFEVFADRCYDDAGRLLPRGRPQAIHTKAQMLAQVIQLVEQQTVTSYGGKTLPLQADTLCVHGDNPVVVDAIKEISALVRQ